MAKELKHIDISSAERKIILSLIETHLPNTTVWAYGSRATWSARPKSDLDLVAFASADQKNAVYDLKEAFEESDLPFRVDFFVWDNVPDEFRGNIERDRVVLVEGKTDWPETALADLAEYVTVGFVGSMASEYTESGITFLRSQNVVPFNIKFEDVKYISPEFHKKISKSSLQHGDVVIVRTGKPGACAVIPENIGECNCSDLVIVRPSDRLDSRFLCYYVNSVTGQYVNAHLVGAVQQHFNVGSAKKMKIPLPPLKTQKAIAHILGTLDDKIDLNRRMNETLEAMAQAIFKSWFVDFDGCTEFEDSELGRVPKGWRVAKIGDEISVVGGGTPATKNKDFWEGGTIHWTTPKDLSQSKEKLLLTTGRRITSKGLAKISSGLLPVNTVLLSSRAPVGYLALAKVPVAVNQGYIAMKCDKDISPEYVIQWCNSIMGEIKNRASGTTFAEISKKNFRNISVLVPEPNILKKYSDIVAGYYDKIYANCKESQNLELIRDSLLPKLISGSLDLGGK
ncbi:restriction endonuclease subunit S [Maridesulfovibrio sp.]|uniref:restriction endonuclease subunit S n=1 Tax=Maridesulfovibrio sp. TaxID=2795000 RepID=UPI003BAA8D3A